jgi:hypothetical protein
VEVAHTNFTKITRVIFIHEDSVVVLTTRHTATGRVLAVFTNSTVTGGDVSALLAVFVSVFDQRKEGEKVKFVSASLSSGFFGSKERKPRFDEEENLRNGRAKTTHWRNFSQTPALNTRDKTISTREAHQTSTANLASSSKNKKKAPRDSDHFFSPHLSLSLSLLERAKKNPNGEMGLSRAKSDDARTTRAPSNRAFERNKMHSVRIKKKRKRRRRTSESASLIFMRVFVSKEWRLVFPPLWTERESPFFLFFASFLSSKFFFLSSLPPHKKKIQKKRKETQKREEKRTSCPTGLEKARWRRE